MILKSDKRPRETPPLTNARMPTLHEKSRSRAQASASTVNAEEPNFGVDIRALLRKWGE
ncbi:MAG: hypothetical protein FD187_2487 [bacterium]|nr:MAG: hypothetical protein FD142_2370 [bacterium]KAF0147779.1 MAG: hypothetical protein FD187_2487 [bacterium]KAF0167860.1 MAG: hypothetical protein FD158_1872 [bacterium]TXT19855.1 MAG: hypothetical protein FD132_1558 [bacterium]